MKLRWWLLLVAAAELIGHHHLDSTTLTQDELNKRFTDIVDSYVKRIREFLRKNHPGWADIPNIEFKMWRFNEFKARNCHLWKMDTVKRTGNVTASPIKGKPDSWSVKGAVYFTTMEVNCKNFYITDVFIPKIVEGRMWTEVGRNLLRFWATFTRKILKEGEEEAYAVELNRVKLEKLSFEKYRFTGFHWFVRYLREDTIKYWPNEAFTQVKRYIESAEAKKSIQKLLKKL